MRKFGGLRFGPAALSNSDFSETCGERCLGLESHPTLVALFDTMSLDLAGIYAM